MQKPAARHPVSRQAHGASPAHGEAAPAAALDRHDVLAEGVDLAAGEAGLGASRAGVGDEAALALGRDAGHGAGARAGGLGGAGGEGRFFVED